MQKTHLNLGGSFLKTIRSEIWEILRLFMRNLKNFFRLRRELTFLENKQVEDMRIETNNQRMITALILIFYMQILNLAANLVLRHHEENTIYFVAASVFSLLVCIVYSAIYFLSKCWYKGIIIKKRRFYISFWVFISIGTFIFAFYDLLESKSLTNFLVIITGAAIIPILNLTEASFIILLNLVLEIASIVLLGYSPNLIGRSILLTFSGIFVSQMFFISYISSVMYQKKLKEYAETDSLTDLPNRRALEAWFEDNKADFIRRRIGITFAIIDIDNFKDYNDRYGHLCGDDCLKIVADCITTVFEKSNGMICRFGGEEFIVILEGVDENHALKCFVLLKNLIQNRAAVMPLPLSSGKITVSVGIAFGQIDPDTGFDTLLEQADRALYTAKESGKNMIVSDDGSIYV
ncbi:MAG: Phytochrome-like protein cph2 [Firmicutes bacterium ADurb.Bin193]|nr:MAG: Phytochrome-like protein cph2 [Firmicutes bacterium ADurb.Bin193]